MIPQTGFALASGTPEELVVGVSSRIDSKRHPSTLTINPKLKTNTILI